ncbi:MAG: hypothetical protein PHC43_00410 [Candidatus Marinimicrobia bacterium]|nr:hypothetical protein [Candidatus Neomarinimicrobiota bacterium]
MKKIGRVMWIIETENRDGYHTGCFDTKAQAQYRLNEIANDNWYLCNESIIARSNDMIKLSDNAVFKIVKLDNCICVK